MNLNPSSLVRLAAAAMLGLLAAVTSYADLYITVTSPTNLALPRVYAPGSSLTMGLLFTGPASGSNQWYHDGQPIAGATGLTLTLNNLTSADSGNYTLEVTIGSSVNRSNDATVNVLPLPPSPVDQTFSCPLPSSPYGLRITAQFADGSMLATTSTGTDTNTVRLTSAGAVDASYSFAANAGSVLAAYPDGRVLVSNSPYRLKADGSPLPLALPAGFNTTQALTAALVQPDGKIIVAQGRQVARLNADDTTDGTFAYSSNLSSQHVVTGFKLDATNRIYVTAIERDPVPSNYPSSWTVMYRLSALGAQDLGFASQEPPLRRGGLGLFPFADGRLLRFSSYETIASWAMLRDDGTVDPAWQPGSTFIVNSYAVDPAHNRIFYVDSGGRLCRALISPTSLTAVDPTFYAGNGSPSTLVLANTGSLYVAGYFAEWDGFATNGLVRLRPDDVVTAFPPVAGIGPGDVTPTRGSTVTFTSGVSGTGPFTYQWLALDGQPLPADSTSPKLVITNFSPAHLGRYQVRVTSQSGAALSNVTRALLSPSNLPYLANLSGRVQVGTGENLAIAGVAVNIRSGALGLPLLIRGAGPALRDYGVTGFLPNPMLNVYNSASALIANNDTWGGAAALLAAFNACGAFPFSPDSNDAALIPTYGTGTYTIHLTDQSSASGVGLLEVYQIPSSLVPGDLTNLSLRARTGPGEQVAIAGFVLVDPQSFDRPTRILVRAIGPTLGAYGIATPLADPILTLYDASGKVVAQNDNWSDSSNAADLSAAAQTVGAFALPANSKDAALLLDLPPGSYTAQATGPANASGVTLIEVYLVR